MGRRAAADHLDRAATRGSTRATLASSSRAGTCTSSVPPRPRRSPSGRGSARDEASRRSTRSGRSLTPVRTPIGDAWILTRDEPTFRAAPGARGVRAAPPERRRLLPPPGSRSRTPGPRRRPSRRALDPSRLAGCRPRRGRGRRDVATRGGDGHRPALAPSLARRTRCGRGGSGVLAAARYRRADRRPLGRPSRPLPCEPIGALRTDRSRE